MKQRRKKRRLLPNVVLFGIVGASMVALAAIPPQPQAQVDRRELAVDMQKEFRKHGLPYAVATSGTQDTVLRIEAPSMTKPFAEFLVQEPSRSEHLGKYGFTTVVFANDQGGSWSYDVDRRRLR
jgi:hypothetical protein